MTQSSGVGSRFNHPYFLPRIRRTLIWQFARRDVLANYRGSMLGIGWSFLMPIAMLIVYTFVFRVVFKARWPGMEIESDAFFALNVYAGLSIFNFLAEVLTRSPRIVLDQANLVKRVVFPLEVLGWVAVLAAAFHLLISLTALVLASWWMRGALPVTLLAVPLVLLPMLPLLLGLAWFLSALGVYVRDIGQVTGMLTTVLMFMSPIFYPVSSLPERWQPLLYLSPVTLIVEELRRVVLNGEWPRWDALMQYGVIACFIAWLGARWFEATRRGFADVV